MFFVLRCESMLVSLRVARRCASTAVTFDALYGTLRAPWSFRVIGMCIWRAGKRSISVRRLWSLALARCWRWQRVLNRRFCSVSVVLVRARAVALTSF